MMKELIEKIDALYAEFKTNADLQESKSNKAAGVRARKSSLEIEKAMKEFRKVSLTTTKEE